MKQDHVRLLNNPPAEATPTGFRDIISDGGVAKWRTPSGALLPFGGGITSDVSGIDGAIEVGNIVVISQANYDALVGPDESTAFIII